MTFFLVFLFYLISLMLISRCIVGQEYTKLGVAFSIMSIALTINIMSKFNFSGYIDRPSLISEVIVAVTLSLVGSIRYMNTIR